MLGFHALGKIAIGELSTESAVVLESGAFVLDGQPALFNQVRVAAVGSFTLSGQAASRVISMRAGAGAFVDTGIAAGLHHGRILVASQTITTTVSHFLFAPLGQFSLGGGALNSQATTFVLTGDNINLNVDNPLTAASGTFILTFIDGALIAAVRPSIIRIFPRVAFGMRAGGRGGGMVAKASAGRSVRARAFGG